MRGYLGLATLFGIGLTRRDDDFSQIIREFRERDQKQSGFDRIIRQRDRKKAKVLPSHLRPTKKRKAVKAARKQSRNARKK